MTFALPFILEAIFNPEFKKSGKTGSARLPRGMKLGNLCSRRADLLSKLTGFLTLSLLIMRNVHALLRL